MRFCFPFYIYSHLSQFCYFSSFFISRCSSSTSYYYWEDQPITAFSECLEIGPRINVPELSLFIHCPSCLFIKLFSFPSIWKHAAIPPIPKHCHPLDPNYQSRISVIRVIPEVSWADTSDQLRSFLDPQELLDDVQCKVWSRLPNNDVLTLAPHSWSATFDNRRKAYLVSIDTSENLDRVLHELYLAKRPTFGFSKSLVLRAWCFLTVRTTSVRGDVSCRSHFL